MKKICSKLVEDIHFTPEKICPCSSFNWKNVTGYEFDDFINIDKNTNPEIVLQYFDIRKSCIKQWQQGNVPDCCDNCFMYSPYEDNDFDNLKRIFIYHRLGCHCKCIYCCLTDSGNEQKFKEINEYMPYDIKPMLNYIEQKFQITDESRIDVFGGECTECPEELNFIIDFAKKYNSKCSFYTNGIIFNENIYNYLKNYKAEVFVSLDCGSDKFYRKIKRVNAFSQVTENIFRYSEAAMNNPNSIVHLKYIIVPNMNDDIDEIKRFFKLARKYGITSLIVSIDKYWLTENQNKKCPKSVKNAIKYFIENKDYPEISVNADYGFLWKWWLDKILSN